MGRPSQIPSTGDQGITNPSNRSHPCSIRALSSISHLELAWRKLRKHNKKSRDILEESLDSFGAHYLDQLEEISSQLRAGTFRFSPVHAAFIEKGDGSLRALKIFAIRDRVVAKGIQLLLAKRLPDPSCSFGSIQGRSAHQALNEIVSLRNQGYEWVFEADLKKFFDLIDRTILIQVFKKHYGRNRLLPLIEGSIAPEIGNRHNLHSRQLEALPAPEKGIPQGSALSPLLANLYLRQFDLAMMEAGYKLVRYVDDFVVLCRSEKEAHSAHDLAKNILESKLKLKMHLLNERTEGKTKTRIFKFSQGFTFLGIRFAGSQRFPSEKSLNGIREQITKICTQEAGLSLVDSLAKLNPTIEGWVNAYLPYDSRAEYQELDQHLQWQLTGLLRRFDLIHGRGNKFGLGHARRIGISTFVSTRDRLLQARASK